MPTYIVINRPVQEMVDEETFSAWKRILIIHSANAVVEYVENHWSTQSHNLTVITKDIDSLTMYGYAEWKVRYA